MSKLKRCAYLSNVVIYNRSKRVIHQRLSVTLLTLKNALKRFKTLYAESIHLEGGNPKGHSISMSFSALQAHSLTQTSIL
jgi:hypothetical protein